MEAQPPPVAAEAAQVLKECGKLANNIPSSKKSNREARKAEERLEQSLKFLNSFHNPEEKLSALMKKYNDVADENKKLHMSSKQWEKKYVLMQREKEQTQFEYSKTLLIKSKLENLCRELQKQIKVTKDESMQRFKEEEDKQNETLSLFQNTISDLMSAIQRNNEKDTKLRNDNLDMAEKFKSVMEQYELQGQQVDKMAKQMALENQLADAKLAKANLEFQTEKEKMLAEKQQLLLDLTQYQARCHDLQSTEVALRSQVAMYTDKYDEFQNALKKSNEVFGGFKGEMEKMSKKLDKQEKEALSWKQRWEKSHAALIDMATDKQNTDSTFALQSRQLAQLQRLCRTMQAERSILLNTLKENNIERPALPQLPPEPKNEGMDRVDQMAANCSQLKQSLSQLQGRLNDLTARRGLENPDAPKDNNASQKKKKTKTKKKAQQDDSEENNEKSSDTPKVLEIDPATLPAECPFSSDAAKVNGVATDAPNDADGVESKEINVDVETPSNDSEKLNDESAAQSDSQTVAQ